MEMQIASALILEPILIILMGFYIVKNIDSEKLNIGFPKLNISPKLNIKAITNKMRWMATTPSKRFKEALPHFKLGLKILLTGENLTPHPQDSRPVKVIEKKIITKEPKQQAPIPDELRKIPATKDIKEIRKFAENLNLFLQNQNHRKMIKLNQSASGILKQINELYQSY